MGVLQYGKMLKIALSASTKPKISLSFEKEIRSPNKSINRKPDNCAPQSTLGISKTLFKISISILQTLQIFSSWPFHPFLVFNEKATFPSVL